MNINTKYDITATIKDIKMFFEWCKQGDDSLEKRQKLFYDRLAAMEKQMAEIQMTMNVLRYKCWYYDTAVATGTEATAHNMPIEQLPDDIRQYKKAAGFH